jgi:hypothetical protein
LNLFSGGNPCKFFWRGTTAQPSALKPTLQTLTTPHPTSYRLHSCQHSNSSPTLRSDSTPPPAPTPHSILNMVFFPSPYPQPSTRFRFVGWLPSPADYFSRGNPCKNFLGRSPRLLFVKPRLGLASTPSHQETGLHHPPTSTPTNSKTRLLCSFACAGLGLSPFAGPNSLQPRGADLNLFSNTSNQTSPLTSPHILFCSFSNACVVLGGSPRQLQIGGKPLKFFFGGGRSQHSRSLKCPP